MRIWRALKPRAHFLRKMGHWKRHANKHLELEHCLNCNSTNFWPISPILVGRLPVCQPLLPSEYYFFVLQWSFFANKTFYQYLDKTVTVNAMVTLNGDKVTVQWPFLMGVKKLNFNFLSNIKSIFWDFSVYFKLNSKDFFRKPTMPSQLVMVK